MTKIEPPRPDWELRNLNLEVIERCLGVAPSGPEAAVI